MVLRQELHTLRMVCDRDAGGVHLWTLITRCCPLISCMQYKPLVCAQHESVVCMMACMSNCVELALESADYVMKQSDMCMTRNQLHAVNFCLECVGSVVAGFIMS